MLGARGEPVPSTRVRIRARTVAGHEQVASASEAPDEEGAFSLELRGVGLDHEVVVLAGSGEAEHAGETTDIATGDVLFVKADALHQFRNTGDEPLQFLCLVPKDRDGGGEVPGS